MKSKLLESNELMSTGKLEKRLLFFSMEDWDDVWRRNQFVCALLHDRHPEAEILWVCPPLDVLHNLKERLPVDLSDLKIRKASSEYPRITICKPIKPLPNFLGRFLNERAMLAQVQQVVKTLGWTRYDLWINDQRTRRYAPLDSAKLLIYDITDDWTKSTQSERSRRTVIEDDKWLLDNADATIVCSEQLRALKKDQAANVVLIPNGVDFERYHPATRQTLSVPKEVASIQHPIAGYTGTLHSDRLDIDLLSKTAKACPKVNFVFVGPNSLERHEQEQLAQHENVHLLGPKPYKELPAYVNIFDLCINPHKINAFTESLDPLKLYEYMSTGLPIISTRCAGFRDHSRLVQLADDWREFSQLVEQATGKSDDALQQARLEWAAQHGWQKRVLEIERLLRWL